MEEEEEVVEVVEEVEMEVEVVFIETDIITQVTEHRVKNTPKLNRQER